MNLTYIVSLISLAYESGLYSEGCIQVYSIRAKYNQPGAYEADLLS